MRWAVRSLLIWVCAMPPRLGADVTMRLCARPTPQTGSAITAPTTVAHSLLKQIDLETVDRLTPKWVFHVPNASHWRAFRWLWTA